MYVAQRPPASLSRSFGRFRMNACSKNTSQKPTLRIKNNIRKVSTSLTVFNNTPFTKCISPSSSSSLIPPNPGPNQAPPAEPPAAKRPWHPFSSFLRSKPPQLIQCFDSRLGLRRPISDPVTGGEIDPPRPPTRVPPSKRRWARSPNGNIDTQII